MTRPRDISITIALCLSLALHVALYLGIIFTYVRENAGGGIIFPGINARELADEQARRDSPTTLPTYLIPRPRDNEMGIANGAGKAPNESPGDEPMRARQGFQEQAWLSRDEQGFGSPDNLPSKSILPPGMGGDSGAGGHDERVSAAPFGARSPQFDDAATPTRRREPATPVSPDQPDPHKVPAIVETPETPKPAPPRDETAKAEKPDQPATQRPPAPVAARTEPAPTAPEKRPDADIPIGALNPPTTAPTPTPEHPPDPKPAEPVALAQATPAPPPAASPASAGDENPSHPTAPGAPGAPGAPVPSADPAPSSDSESDAFSNVGSANFQPGRVSARFGRKVKTVRPRISEAGKWDLAAMQSTSVVLKVKIDETGKVTSVDILRSSGSNNIDLPCRLALYEWWIEPPKDKDGKPIADVMTWTLSFG